MKKPENNPLVDASLKENGKIPLDQVKPEHFMPALEWAMDKAKKRYADIKATGTPTFENVIEAMEDADRELSLISSVFFNLSSVKSDSDMQQVEQKFSAALSAYSTEIALDQDLFNQIKAVHDQKDAMTLDSDQSKLLEDAYKGFVRSGALLGDNDKERLADINQALSAASVKFRQNVLKDTEAFKLWVEDEADLKGVPEDNVKIAKEAAEEEGEPSKYLLTLDIPQVIAVLSYADNRDLREKMWRAYQGRARSEAHDNQPVILETMKLRHEKAALLGYSHHAEFVLEDRMAKQVSNVTDMLDELREAAFDGAKKDHDDLASFAKSEGLKGDLKPWDISYYAEKLMKKDYGFDEQEFKPYFEFEKTLKGAFDVAEKLYDVELVLNKDYPTYHDDVKAYDAFDKKTGKKLAVLVTDFFVRKGKRGGAWMNVYRDQGQNANGERIVPVVGMHGNFQKPSKDTPSLLSFNDVETLFHEFGHALHGMLSDVRYKSQAGPNVKWDFVELPSQVLENWVSEKEVLDMFAQHYKETDEKGGPKKIPAELLKKREAAKNFRSASQTLRQVKLGMLDMAWHTSHPSNVTDVGLFEREALKGLSFMPDEGALTSPSFSHIFAGGYSAGYYSYKWAEVLDADAFEAFKEKGLFDKETADKFKEILKSGGSVDPEILYRTFRGRDADKNALLKRSGLMKSANNDNKAAKKNRQKPRR